MAGRHGMMPLASMAPIVTLLCFQLHCHALELKPDLNTDALALIEYLLSLAGVNVSFPQFMDHLKDALNWAPFHLIAFAIAFCQRQPVFFVPDSKWSCR